MLFNNHSVNPCSYGFSFTGSHQERVAGIYSVGWEKKKGPTYDWDGMNRSESDVIIFQYTLRGCGEIMVRHQTYSLEVGDAFFVKVPSEHRYYLPESSDEWEFIYITLSGNEAITCCEKIENDLGNVFRFNVTDPPIVHLLKLLEKVTERKIQNAYDISSEAYTFLMKLQYFLYNRKSEEDIPSTIVKTLLFIEKNYADTTLSLQDIIEDSELSRHQLSKLFQKTVHATPIQYVSQMRINKSIELLKNKGLTVEEIARKVGFSNGNYFNKVFRSYTGISAGKYRNNKLLIPVDHFISD